MNGDLTRASNILVSACMGRVRGIDSATGRLLWEVQLQEGGALTAAIQEAMEIVVRDDVVLVAPSSTDELTCINYRSGALIGKVKVGIGRKTMLVEDGRIFVGVSGNVKCLTFQGELLWEDHPEGVRGCVAFGFPGNVRQADQE